MTGAGAQPIRGVLRNSAVLAVAKGLERVTGFAVALLVASTLGVEGLGVYAVAWAIYGVIAIAGDAGTTVYLVREISRDPSRTAAYTVHLSVVALAAAGTLMLIAQLVVPHLGYSPTLETSVSVVLLAILPRILNAVQEAVFIAHGRVAFETLTRLVSSIAYVLLAAWLLAQGHGVPALLRAFVAIEYAVAVVYFVLISRYIVRLRPRFDWRLAVRLLGEMKAFAASSALAALFARPEIIILSLLATERQAGLYSAALRIAELPLVLPEVFMANVFPLLSQTFRTAESRFAAWQATAVRAVLAFSLPLAACSFAAAGGIVTLVFGDEFGPAAPILRILALNLVLFSLISVFWRSLVARDRQGTNVAVQALMVVVRLGAAVALVVPLAAVGAAIASAVSGLMHLILLVVATARSGAPSQILRAAWRYALAAAAAGLCVWLAGRWLPTVFALAAGVVVYLAAALVVGAVTPEDRAQLRRLRESRLSRRASRPGTRGARAPH